MATNEQPPWQQPVRHAQANLPPLKIWNSLTRSKTPFIPKDPEGRRVTWYVCGPTVYDDAHLGHARNYVTTDVIRRIMRDYFHFDVKFIMNVTDVDDKIILAAREKHFLANYIAKHPVIDVDVVQTARLALSTFIKKKLPLLDPNVPPCDFQEKAEEAYKSVINGGALDGNKKPGAEEAKIKMNIKSGSRSAKTISQAFERTNATSEILTTAIGSHESSPILEYTPETFYKDCEDVFFVHLDSLYSSSIRGDDHSIFEEWARFYETRFMEDMRNLNVLDPDELTNVTKYSHEIVDFVQKIVENKFGYVTPDGSVYFDINAFEQAGNHYAKLEPWNRNDGQLQKDGEGSLTKSVKMKLSKNDFALWKSSQPGEPSWTSPWGEGRPGWHIECSAMASAKFGDQMDIHSGGIDLAFPHHDNELAQSEAHWCARQWVNYFLHMGHLSIQGAKMSKSLKNFTTIREALGTWNSRSLRIVFLLGHWSEGIEITEDMITASKAWEEKLNNFFLKVKSLSFPERSSLHDLATDDSLTESFKLAQSKVFNALCDSFDTPNAMTAISELVTRFNSAELPELSGTTVESLAKWITSLVNIFGLNGTASADSPEIGWSGIDIPEYAKPYLDSLSAARDAIRKLAKSKSLISTKMLGDILSPDPQVPRDQGIPEPAQPYSKLLDDFRQTVTVLGAEGPEDLSKELLMLCDRIRDVDLFGLGIYLEDQPEGPAIVRPVTRDIISMRQKEAERAWQRQKEKEEREQKVQEKKEKGRISHLEMFKTPEFSAWDQEGLPTKDSAGNDVTKSRIKKLRKEWERQKRVHEAWVTHSSV